MLLMTALAALLALPLFLPTLADLVSLLVAPLRRTRPRRLAAPTEREPRLLFLIPAHNEELLLARTLRSVRAMDYPLDRVHCIVIADNCDDRTADVARAEGVECLDRQSERERGKPYAIRWALDRIDLSRHDAVVVLDADSFVNPEFARCIAARGPVRAKVIQPFGDVSNPTENALTRMSAVFSVARFVYMNGLKAPSGLNVPLVNGTVFGSDVLSTHGWPAFSITETWEMYALLTARGVRIECAPDAHTYSQEARSLAQSGPQRRRWGAGKLWVLLHTSRAILGSRAIGWHQKLDAMGELIALGPVVHTALAACLLALTWWMSPPGGGVIVLLLALSIARQVAYAMLATASVAEPWSAARAFLYLPIYALWRVALQLRIFASVNAGNWVRTSRHAE
ncbi:MAG TPA: glycosyltransferase family 2 protein [Gemmatimonadaceae bacterium]|nr:glycosyltransferase family 2 protein [Gemmatimonadaceae bacterium]